MIGTKRIHCIFLCKHKLQRTVFQSAKFFSAPPGVFFVLPDILRSIPGCDPHALPGSPQLQENPAARSSLFRCFPEVWGFPFLFLWSQMLPDRTESIRLRLCCSSSDLLMKCSCQIFRSVHRAFHFYRSVCFSTAAHPGSLSPSAESPRTQIPDLTLL